MGPGILRIPNELVAQVTSYLTNSDIKTLRLTCKAMESRAFLPMKRAFLSSNRRDVDAFMGIASHETWRHQVKEIIWDDSQLMEKSETSSGDSLENGDSASENSPKSPTGFPKWFFKACRLALNISDNAFNRIKGDMPLADSWAYYEELLKQQKEVLKTAADAEAFVYGLQQFSSLSRVTITPAAHGLLDAPLCPTPTIRAFPSGFIYPIPHGWPLLRLSSPLQGDMTWQYDLKVDLLNLNDRKNWRGFAYMMEVLAAHRHGGRVVELVMDTGDHPTGINCNIFTERCEAYNDLLAVLQRPGFRRLDLSLLSEGLYTNGTNWEFFRSGLLLEALKGAKDMQHFSLHMQMDVCKGVLLPDGESPTARYSQNYIPLRSIFPIQCWPRLRHFGMSRMVVWLDDVMNLLKALPPTLRSVELSFLQFLDNETSYADLLSSMRTELRWHERPAAEQPQVSIHFDPPRLQMLYSYMCVDDEVNRYLYNGEMNPFNDVDPLP